MWNINARNVIHLGRTPGGDRFTEFVDACIYAACSFHGVPLSSLSRNLRTNKQDGGVDTCLRDSIQKESSGWFGTQTIWQYKAVEANKITEGKLKAEVNAPYAKELLEQGFGYRFVICDEISVQKRQELTAVLTTLVHGINPTAPSPIIITAGDLAAFATSYPSIALEYFAPPQLAELATSMQSWHDNITRLTGNYVELAPLRDTMSRIAHHVDFSHEVNNVLFTVQGEAGVGKTRMVFEAVSKMAARHLTLYTNDESHAILIARLLVNSRDAKAILVADECSLNKRMQIQDLLAAYSDRVRLIAIDNSGERFGTTEEAWIENMTDDEMVEILAANFPEIPQDYRRTYADLSDGFIRLGIDMCMYHSQIVVAGDTGPVLNGVKQYYRRRLDEPARKFVEAIALFDRLGWNKDTRQELEAVCEFLSLSLNDFSDALHKLKDSPGFVARAGRYVYVTPELIAQVALGAAWERWVENDVENFLSRIPEIMLIAFLNRISRSAEKEVRSQVGDFFRHWFNSINAADLATVQTAHQAISLMETSPDEYVSAFCDLLLKLTKEELEMVRGDGASGWGPRRHYVWFAERIAAFPQYFGFAEKILFQFALAENEPGIGNNATGVWQGLFSVWLSGTATPFLERLHVLKQRIAQYPTLDFVWKPFDYIFTSHASRVVGPSVIAGRLAPSDWAPKTIVEQTQVFKETLSFLAYLVQTGDKQVRLRAQNAVLNNLGFITQVGFINEIMTIFPEGCVDEEVKTTLYNEIRDLIELDIVTSERDRERLHHIMDSLFSDDTHGLLLRWVSRDPYSYMHRSGQEQWEPVFSELATTLLRDSNCLERELVWLVTHGAKGAWVLGRELGKLDSRLVLLNRIIQLCSHGEGIPGLVRGYIEGLVNEHLHAPSVVSERINGIIDSAPKVAYELFLSGGRKLCALERILSLVETDKIPVSYLRALIYSQEWTAKDFMHFLRVIYSKFENNSKEAYSIAVSAVANVIGHSKKLYEELLDTSEFVDVVFDIMKLAGEHHMSEEYWWERVILELASKRPSDACKLACQQMLNIRSSSRTLIVQSQLAKAYPQIFMKALGELILDASTGYHFYVGKYTSVINSIPLEILKEWITDNGEIAAERIARHVPAPYIENGDPAVPEITDFILSNFSGSDRVFREFCAGVHSLQLYSGDIASQHEGEAEIASKFLNHPNTRIRQWARDEIKHSRAEAAMWRQMIEEQDLGR